VVEVDATALEGRSVLIATGARPAPLGFPGEEHVITSDQFLELESLPERIDLVGGGYITAEFSHIAARAGARVTSLQRGEQILPKFDPDLVGWLMEKFVAADVEVRTSTTVEKVERTDGACRVHARTSGHEITVEADLVVHAAGRVPDLDALSVAAEGHGLAGEHCELWLNASPAASFLGAVFEDSPASQCDAPLSLELRRGRGTP
jgi:glutathione reductase (NADPH)